MKSTLTTLVIVIILVIAGAFMFRSNDVDQVNNSTNNAVTNQSISNLLGVTVDDGDIYIPDSLKTCQTVDDCSVVIDHCGYCSCGAVIGLQYQDSFDNSFDQMCQGYQGGICDMGCLPSTLDCLEGICTLS